MTTIGYRRAPARRHAVVLAGRKGARLHPSTTSPPTALPDDHRAAGTPLTTGTPTRLVPIDVGVLGFEGGLVSAFEEKTTVQYTVSKSAHGRARLAHHPLSPGLPYGFDDERAAARLPVRRPSPVG